MFEEFKPEKLLELYYFPLLFPFHNEFVFIMPFLISTVDSKAKLI